MQDANKLPRREPGHFPAARSADPNPVLLFSLYGGMLMTAAGLFYRLVTRDGGSGVFDQAAPALRELCELFDRAQPLQNDHTKLIFQAGIENDAVYPIGEHTMWTADLCEYRRIRDESVQLLVGISREALRVGPFPLDQGQAEQVTWGLKTLQRSIELSWQPGAFREVALALSGGFEAATSSLDALTKPRHDDLDDEFMLFA